MASGFRAIRRLSRILTCEAAIVDELARGEIENDRRDAGELWAALERGPGELWRIPGPNEVVGQAMRGGDAITSGALSVTLSRESFVAAADRVTTMAKIEVKGVM